MTPAVVKADWNLQSQMRVEVSFKKDEALCWELVRVFGYGF